jgi:hypothetical protein
MQFWSSLANDLGFQFRGNAFGKVSSSQQLGIGAIWLLIRRSNDDVKKPPHLSRAEQSSQIGK